MHFLIASLIATLLNILRVCGNLGPQGCEEDWIYFKNYCYYFVNGRVHFDSAKAVCALKHSTLVSLWRPDEFDFVQDNLEQLDVPNVYAWIGAISTKNNRWMWMDGSFFDVSNQAIPPANQDRCGSISADGQLKFLNCEDTVPAFVCKKALDMLYIPSTMNITSDLVKLNDGQSATVFERLWPPSLDKISLAESNHVHLATVDVNQETDCAYRCYTLEECKSFIVKCKSARKCNSFNCSLLSKVLSPEDE